MNPEMAVLVQAREALRVAERILRDDGADHMLVSVNGPTLGEVIRAALAAIEGLKEGKS